MVCPGNIVGDMKEASISEARASLDEETRSAGREAGEDIARIITFLCDEHSDYITGTVIEATGGLNVINRHSLSTCEIKKIRGGYDESGISWSFSGNS